MYSLLSLIDKMKSSSQNKLNNLILSYMVFENTGIPRSFATLTEMPWFFIKKVQISLHFMFNLTLSHYPPTFSPVQKLADN